MQVWFRRGMTLSRAKTPPGLQALFIGRVAPRGNRVNISDILIALSSISSTGENRRDAGSHVIARYSGIEIRISNHMVDSATGESVNPEIPGR